MFRRTSAKLGMTRGQEALWKMAQCREAKAMHMQVTDVSRASARLQSFTIHRRAQCGRVFAKGLQSSDYLSYTAGRSLDSRAALRLSKGEPFRVTIRIKSQFAFAT